MESELAQKGTGRAEKARWSVRLIELDAVWRKEPRAARRHRVLEEIWVLLITALSALMRSSAARFGQDARQEFRDLAVDKSLDLMGKLQSGEWRPSAMTPSQLYGFLATVARNGLVDHVRADKVRADGMKHLRSTEPQHGRETVEPTADSELTRIKWAEALAGCSGKLTPRARRAWFLRVFYELPSKKIAKHKAVGMSAPAVDVSLSRARASIRKCLEDAGFDSRSIPPGAFVRVWAALEAARPRAVKKKQVPHE